MRDRADPERAVALGPRAANRAGRGARDEPSPAVTRALLVGGSSEIGLAIVRRLAADGPVSAGPARAATADGSRARPTRSTALGCHARARSRWSTPTTLGRPRASGRPALSSTPGGFDVVVLAVGLLGAQAGLDADPDEAVEVMRVNFLGAGSLLLHCLRRLRAQGSGTLIVLSSVAAERPRAGNAIYGAAKAGLDALAQGLADADRGQRRAGADRSARDS